MDRSLTFHAYQQQAAATDRVRGEDLHSMMVPLLGLAGEAGSLLSEFKKWLREGPRYKPFSDQVSEEIGDILWYLANIADKMGLDLQEIAEENLAKIAERWSAGNAKEPPQLFTGVHEEYDAQFPEGERLPGTHRVVFREQFVDGRLKLVVRRDGSPFGSPLTDNAHSDDGYRYHDVFHLTYATLLGWSPIIRRLLKLKRKSVPQIDEIEDGARAAVTEEAISALAFAYAKDYSYFEGADSINYELLRAIKWMTRPFEVRDKGLRDWEEAILRGFSVWRMMTANHGGTFVGDAVSRTVRYEPISIESDGKS